MRRTTSASVILTLAALAIFSMYKETPAQRPANTQSSPAAPDISYTVSMSKPWTHLLEVEMRVRSNQMPSALQLNMPVWTPGSYLIREYERHVQDFDAKSTSGAALTWDKVNKNTWQIDT